MNQLFIGGFHPVLEDALIRQIEKRMQSSRIGSLTIVVPHPLLGRYLTRLIAGKGISTFGLKFITLQNFLEQLAESYLKKFDLTVLPNFAEQILVKKIISNSAEKLNYLSEISESRGIVTGLLSWLYECGAAGVSRDDLIQLYQKKDQKKSVLSDLLFLGQRYWQRLSEMKLVSSSEIPLLSIKSFEEDSFKDDTIFFYGFYHFNPVQRKLLKIISEITQLLVFFPYRESSHYQYSNDSLKWLRSLAFESIPLEEIHHEGLGVETNSIQIISAPNVESESETILNEIQSDSVDELWDCCILTRKPNAIYHQWRDLINLTGFKSWIQNGEPLIETVAGRSLQLIIKLIQGRFRRDLLLDFLSHAPLQVGDQIGMNEYLNIQSEWESLSRGLGIREYLAKNKDEILFRKTSFLKLNQKLSSPLSEESVELFFTVVGTLFEFDQPLQIQDTFFSHCSLIRRSLKKILTPDCEGLDKVYALLDDLEKFSDCLEEVSYGDFLATLLDILNSERIPSGRYERDGIALTGILSTYGVQWKEVFIPCLQSGVFDHFASNNSIFTDKERMVLNERLNRISKSSEFGFELESRKYLEEELLFHLALESASNKLMLSYHRFESGMSREDHPSNQLLQLCRRMIGDESSDNPFARFPGFKRIELDHFYQSVPERNSITTDFNLSLAENELSEDVAANFLSENYNTLKNNALVDRSRLSGNVTEYDAFISNPDSLKILAEKDSPFLNEISVSRLENYATCPFQFFLNYILGLNEKDEPEWVEIPSRLEEGNLVHLIYEKFFKQLKTKGGVSGKDGLDLENQVEEIEQNNLGYFENRHTTGIDLLWDGKKKTLDRDLKKFLKQESEGMSDWEPLDFEIEFNRNVQSIDDYPYQAIKIDLPNGKKVYIRGKIDRCDRKVEDDGREKIKVIDYKTSKKPRKKTDLTSTNGALFDKGQKLQLPIYIMAAESIFPDATVEDASYKFSTHRGEFLSQSFDAGILDTVKDELFELIQTICENWNNGNFIQVPGDHCSYCPYRGGACEDGREIRAEKKESSSSMTEYLKIAKVEAKAKEKLI